MSPRATTVHEVWQVGPHILGLADPEDGGLEEFFDSASQYYDVAWVDPPWGEGTHRAARRANRVPEPADYDAMFAEVARQCLRAPATFVETGRRVAMETIRRFEAAGHELEAEWEVTYGGGKPCVLLGFGERDWPNLAGMRVEDAVIEAVRPGEVVMDPWLGGPRIPRGAALAGGLVAAAGVYPRKLDDAVRGLERLAGVDGERVS